MNPGKHPQFDVLKELVKLYEAYEVHKIRLNHYYQVRWHILKRMGRTGPRPIGAMSYEGTPSAGTVYNFQAEAENLLAVETTIAEIQETIDAYEDTFYNIHQMFERYKNKKYMVLVMRMNGKSNIEIADELNLSEERVRHIVVELNREIREKTKKDGLW